ncbi:DUF975 family protein [Butyrivibrio sp. AE3004]|uniref:DUF975 family protein n=1 Tax=Butyrivibrio sp. AE3004 TaxID=1506994 RepID=UPI00049486FA|nr:DUF975 family protein [Butyrivibrio sp. AE3004]
MKQNKRTSKIKAVARERLLGNYGTSTIAIILYRFITFIIINIVVGAIIPNNLISYFVYFAATILVNLFFGVFDSGLAYLFMNVVYGQSVSIADLFQGFKNHPDKAIILQIPLALIDTLTIIPLQLFSVILAQNKQIEGIIDPRITIAVLAVSAVITIVNVYVRLMFSQSYYILQDFPDKDAFSILKTSIKLMKGHKHRLLLLYLSYIPLFILGTLACFIPLIWVVTYLSAADAAFYQDLVQNSQNN